MTTAPPPIRTLHAPGPRPGPAGHAPAGSGASALDPMKLLKQYYPYLILALMIGTGLGVAVHFVWLNARPEYTATVLFECLPPLDKPGEATRREMGRDDQERYVGTQVALM